MAVTTKDVARVAGVSTAVVSYVLNDGPRPVSDGARERVLAAVAQLGYRRDGVARSLASGRSHSLGLIVPDVNLGYFGAAVQEISQEANRRGRQLLVSTTDWDMGVERRQLQALAESRVEAVVLMSVDPSQADEVWATVGAPVIVVDRPAMAVEGARTVTRHLLDHGHRKIGLLGGPAGLVISERREGGWRQALVEAGFRSARSRVVRGATTFRAGYQGVDRLLAAGCTALLAEQDVLAIGALRRLHDLGLSSPADMAVATMDSTGLAEFSVPSVTALAQPQRRFGPLVLDTALAPGAVGVHHLDIAGFELAARESCGC